MSPPPHTHVQVVEGDKTVEGEIAKVMRGAQEVRQGRGVEVTKATWVRWSLLGHQGEDRSPSAAQEKALVGWAWWGGPREGEARAPSRDKDSQEGLSRDRGLLMALQHPLAGAYHDLCNQPPTAGQRGCCQFPNCF